MRSYPFVIAVVLVTATCSGCTVNNPIDTAANDSQLHILVSIPPLYSMTLNVVGNAATVDYLLPPGAEPHDYALSPNDLAKINQADIIIINGLGFEQFLEDVLTEAKATGSQVIIASDGIELLDSEPGYDPHLWLSVANGILETKNISAALQYYDPEQAEVYAKNTSEYVSRLQTLHDTATTNLNSVSHKQFIALHPAWVYFANAYDLEQVAVIEEITGQEPSAQDLVKLLAAIETYDIPALFTEPQIPDRIIQSLSQDTGLLIYSIDPEGTSVDFSADLYENLMRQNIDTFVQALR